MRTNARMTDEDFEYVLDEAVSGWILTDQGVDEPTRLALEAVAADPSLDNIIAARTVFAASTR